MSAVKVIPLELVELALHSRKISAYQRRTDPKAGCRWAAMTAHVQTNECRRNARRFQFHVKAMLAPMFAGHLATVLEQVRANDGLQGVKRTWGAGYRVMQAATRSEVMR